MRDMNNTPMNQSTFDATMSILANHGGSTTSALKAMEIVVAEARTLNLRTTPPTDEDLVAQACGCEECVDPGTQGLGGV